MKFRALLIVPVLMASAAPAATPDMKALRQGMADYGSCIVKYEPAKAREFVLSGGFVSRRNQDEQALLSTECMPGEDLLRVAMGDQKGLSSRGKLRLPDVMIRWAIAQALFDREAASITATNFASVPALTYEEPYPVSTTDRDGNTLSDKRIALQRQKFEEKAADVTMAKLGECVARMDGAGTRAVLLTALDTPEELASLKAVTSAIGNCLPKGQTLKFDRMSLRGSLAVAYYRLASAAQPSGAAS